MTEAHNKLFVVHNVLFCAYQSKSTNNFKKKNISPFHVEMQILIFYGLHEKIVMIMMKVGKDYHSQNLQSILLFRINNDLAL